LKVIGNTKTVFLTMNMNFTKKTDIAQLLSLLLWLDALIHKTNY